MFLQLHEFIYHLRLFASERALPLQRPQRAVDGRRLMCKGHSDLPEPLGGPARVQIEVQFNEVRYAASGGSLPERQAANKAMCKAAVRESHAQVL